MLEDKFDMDVVEVYPTNPMTYAFEPVRKKPVQVFAAEEAAAEVQAPGEGRKYSLVPVQSLLYNAVRHGVGLLPRGQHR